MPDPNQDGIERTEFPERPLRELTQGLTAEYERMYQRIVQDIVDVLAPKDARKSEVSPENEGDDLRADADPNAEYQESEMEADDADE